MTRPSREKWSATLFGAAFLANSLLGCGGPNLNGYRLASEHAASPVATTETIDPSDADANSTSQTPSPMIESTLNGQMDELELAPVSAIVPVNVVASVRALMSIPASDSRLVESSTTSNSTDSEPTRVTEAAVPSEPRKIEVAIKEKSFRTEPKTGALRVSFDDLDLLKVLNMDPVVDNAVELMPDWLKGLHGKTVRLRGFMYPTYDTEGIEHFVLARDNQICCFGRDPKIYDLVQVDMKAGKTTNYIPYTRAFDVVGKLRIEMLALEGKPYGLYVIDEATVIDR